MARFNTETDRTRDGTNFTLYVHKGRVASQETREKLRQKALEQWKRQKERIIV